VLLLLSLVVVVGLAKALTPAVDEGIAALGAPKAVVGIIIAAVVLMPEGMAALRAAHFNRLQTAMNLALGLRAYGANKKRSIAHSRIPDKSQILNL
jgi:Ca2+:H+ antiporter